MADDAIEDSAAVLVSMRSSPSKRPLRQRQRNRRIFGYDDVVNQPSPKRQARGSSPQAIIPTTFAPAAAVTPAPNILDKRAAQILGTRLRNLLKLPQAHKWVCYEWFYSTLDRALFCGENDFQIVLRENFPGLKNYHLHQVEWCKIRRLMGKPRRCSAAFFAEERRSVEQKRQKIRLLQQRKVTELAPSEFKDLPVQIPLPLVIGTKVTARLRVPQDGLFTGTVEALDTMTNTYRITFDRVGLGTHSIPDYEVLSVEPQESVPLSNFQQKHRPQPPLMTRYQMSTPPRGISSAAPLLQLRTLENDPLLGFSPLHTKGVSLDSGTYGGFPVKFLNQVTKLSKILMVKKDKVLDLKDLNTQAERMQSYGQPIGMDFQRKYACVVLELDELNRRLDEHLAGVHRHCAEITASMLGPVNHHHLAAGSSGSAFASPGSALLSGGGGSDQRLLTTPPPGDTKAQCDREAEEMVFTKNEELRQRSVRSESAVTLITKLVSLMLQIKAFGENNLSTFEFRSVQDTLDELKAIVEPSNISCLRNNVEVHINHIQSGMTQLGNLHAFASSTFD